MHLHLLPYAQQPPEHLLLLLLGNLSGGHLPKSLCLFKIPETGHRQLIVMVLKCQKQLGVGHGFAVDLNHFFSHRKS